MPRIRLNIATKLYAVALLSLAAVGALAVAAVHFAGVTEHAARELYHEGFVGVEHSARLQLRLEQHRRIVESAPAELDRARLKHSSQSLEAIHQQLKELISESWLTDGHQTGAELAAKIATDLPDLMKFGQEVISLAENFAQDQSLALAQGDYDRVAKAIGDYIRIYRRKCLEIADADVADLLSSAASLNRWTFLSTVAALLLIGPFGLWITRSVLSRLNRITRSIIRLASYDTSIEVPSRADRDEVGDIARAVEVFKKNAIELLSKKGELEQVNLRLDVALNNMTHGLCMFDPEERLIVCNQRFAAMYSLPPPLTRPGTTLQAIIEHSDASGHYPTTYTQRSGHRPNPNQTKPTALTNELADGRIIAISHQPMFGGGWVAVHEDVTERRRAEEEITRLARRDALTNLPNRMMFREGLEKALMVWGAGKSIAVMCLDLDHFKNVNDTLGHAVGDALLQAVAERLRQCTREADVVSRLGGDEFAIVQVGIASREEANTLAGRLVEMLGEPFHLNGHEVVLGTSIGIAMAPQDGSNPDALLKCADMALYRAKAEGRRTFRFFEPEMDAELQARRALELDLQKAFAHGEFKLVYQPLVSLKTNRVCAFETLLRWQHPKRGMVSPSEFIPVAEEIGLIVPITEWVLREACAEACKWPQDIKVAVNLSPVQFRRRHPLQPIINALAASGLPASRLEVEITESLFLQEEKSTVAALHELRGFGVRIAMDDFGTGYSSLSYLRSFPFDKIKIDRSFITGLTEGDSSVIVELIANLGSRLNMSTVAEGVETREQLERLRELGCTQVQGYLFSQPVPSSEVAGVIAGCRARPQAAA